MSLYPVVPGAGDVFGKNGPRAALRMELAVPRNADVAVWLTLWLLGKLRSGAPKGAEGGCERRVYPLPRHRGQGYQPRARHSSK